VTLARAAGQLILEVEDDGIGIHRTTDTGSRSGRGLRNLRERASMTGGEFIVGNRPGGGGTRARIEWQLPATREDNSNAA